MPLLKSSERRFLEAVAKLAYCNHFLPERMEHEKAALGADFLAGESVWSTAVGDPDLVRANVVRISEKLQPLVDDIRDRLTRTTDVSSQDLGIYEGCVHYLLYQRFRPQFVSANGNWKFYRNFLAEWNQYLQIPGKQFETTLEPAHVFACFQQIQKAFDSIFDNIIGNSLPAAELRASVWQSIFTHDMRRFRRTMYRKMADFPTLITGASGTGKELVARAIAQSRYVPFDAGALRFADEQELFLPINVAALSPTLIESELFGHRRGSFTGAIADRKGWLEACPVLGSVFLDELGEMDFSMQVKLLRVIETRRFSPVGDTAVREFHGKLIAATNRRLPVEIREHRFREDLYYRLCADLIETPSLADQIENSPENLRELLLYMTRRAVGDEAGSMLPEIEQWIKTHLPQDYRWPGNYRELEQCVRNIVIRRSYRPLRQEQPDDATERFFENFRAGQLNMSEVVSHYVAQVYRQTGSYEEAARRLELDRRTVKAKVQEYLSGNGL
jgi:transcriptional regulator of acetoin/glycerol metabolism